MAMPRGERVARRISSVFFLLSRDSAFRTEARTELAMPSPKFDPTATGPSGLATANQVVRPLSEYTGRGPTKARTSFGDDLVTVVVRDLLSRGERSLVRDGRADLVLDLRRAYQARRATSSPTESKRSPDTTRSPSSAPSTSTPTCIRTLRRSCRPPPAHSCFRPSKRTSTSSNVRRSHRTRCERPAALPARSPIRR